MNCVYKGHSRKFLQKLAPRGHPTCRYSLGPGTMDMVQFYPGHKRWHKLLCYNDVHGGHIARSVAMRQVLSPRPAAQFRPACDDIHDSWSDMFSACLIIRSIVDQDGYTASRGRKRDVGPSLTSCHYQILHSMYETFRRRLTQQRY